MNMTGVKPSPLPAPQSSMPRVVIGGTLRALFLITACALVFGCGYLAGRSPAGGSMACFGGRMGVLKANVCLPL